MAWQTGKTFDVEFNGAEQNIAVYVTLKEDLKFHVVERYDITTNKSELTFTAFFAPRNPGVVGYTAYFDGEFTLDGTAIATFTAESGAMHATAGSTYEYVPIYSGSSVWSYTTTVDHNSNGTKSVAIGYRGRNGAKFYNAAYPYTSGVYAFETSASESKDLTTIPRAATISASNGTIGAQHTVSISAPYAGFSIKITWTCGSASGTILNTTTPIPSSATWTPPDSIMSSFPAATSASCVITATTYSGSTVIGTSSVTVTLSFPANVRPYPSISVSDAMGYASTYGGYVQGQSKAAVTVTDGNQYSATTASRSTSANRATYTAASFTTGALVSSGTNTISTTVRDSRGRTGTASTSITVLAYTAPSISSFGVHRTDSTGTADDNGEYFVCSYTVAITALNNHNSKTLTMRYRPVGGSWTSVSITLSAYSQSGTTSPIAISTDSSYEVQLSLADDFSTITRRTTLSTTPSVISFKAGGLGAAFGKAAETDNLLDVAWDIRARQTIWTNFNGGVAPTACLANSSTIEDLITELRYSNGAMGSVSIGTAYTKDGVTVSAAWYNFLWIPHRIGGLNGEANNDNCNYGTLLLFSMTGSQGIYRIRFSNSSIAELNKLL